MLITCVTPARSSIQALRLSPPDSRACTFSVVWMMAVPVQIAGNKKPALQGGFFPPLVAASGSYFIAFKERENVTS